MTRVLLFVSSLSLAASASANAATEPVRRCHELSACSKACERDDAEACASAGAIARDARESPRLFARYLRKACELGSEGGCESLAAGFDFHGITPSSDQEPAQVRARLEFLRRQRVDARRVACEQGDHGACVELASAHAHGIGATKDRKLALAILKRSCAARDAVACGMIDFARLDNAAPKWTKRACELGGATSCRSLVTLHRDRPGRATIANARWALTRLESICTKAGQEDASHACWWVADVYNRQGLVKRDPAKALRFCERANTLGKKIDCRDAVSAPSTDHAANAAKINVEPLVREVEKSRAAP